MRRLKPSLMSFEKTHIRHHPLMKNWWVIYKGFILGGSTFSTAWFIRFLKKRKRSKSWVFGLIMSDNLSSSSRVSVITKALFCCRNQTWIRCITQYFCLFQTVFFWFVNLPPKSPGLTPRLFLVVVNDHLWCLFIGSDSQVGGLWLAGLPSVVTRSNQYDYERVTHTAVPSISCVHLSFT